MATSQAPPSKPLVLEHFHNVSQAAIRLGLRPPEEDSKRGEKWLRDGVNRPADGSEGTPFPGRYMAGRLMFSDSDLAAIAEIQRIAPPPRRGRKPRNTRRRTAA